MKKYSIADEIKKLNAAYRKATAAQRRVMIAKDALKQIKAGQFLPTYGTYVEVSGTIALGESTQNALVCDELTCRCCAKGALFLSAVRLGNEYTGDPTGIGSGRINVFVKWPWKNYEAIERRFESETDSDDDPDEVLTSILRNVIKNNGTFKP